MKNYLGLAAVTVLAAAAIAGVACTASADNGEPSVFNVSESGSQIELSPGDSLVVTLDSNPSTGYAWSISEIGDEAVIDEVSNEFVGAETGMVGAGGQEVWTFKAGDKGTSTIEMQYSRSWETDVEPETT
ncbi:MAG: protease inhibitor I42 family protein, partial [Dehalococcoidia bacterium]